MSDPLILGIVNEVSLRRALAETPGYRFQWADAPLTPISAVTLAADIHPALIVVELSAHRRVWLPSLRSDPATRRIPVIAVGIGTEAEQEAASLRLPFYAPDAFDAGGAEMLSQHARRFEQTQQLAEGCERPLPTLVRHGLYEFNAGAYFECHETLETAWKQEAAPVREVYRAILQVSVAYLQIVRGNYPGAYKMFLRSVQWFAPLPDTCQGIDIAGLRADAAAARAHLEALGPARIREFDRALLKPIRYT